MKLREDIIFRKEIMNENNTVIQISIGSNHIVYYDRTKGMYIVSLIDADGNAENEIMFDAYEEKEISNRTELIGYLSLIKDRMMCALGNHKYLNAHLFGNVMDRIIKKIYEME